MKNFIRIFKLLILSFNFLFCIVFYFVSKFYPKNNNLILFGSWNGKLFKGDVKFLYLHMINNQKKYTCIWITKNIEIYKLLKSNNLPCYYWLSFKGFIAALRAKYYFISHSHFDINQYFSGGAIILNLMHYVYCPKYLGRMLHANNLLKKIYSILSDPITYVIDNTNFYICSSKFIENRVKKIYKISNLKNKTIIIPNIKKEVLFLESKLDYLIKKEKNNLNLINKSKKNIFYLPTHRKSNLNFNLFNYNFNINELEKTLNDNNANLYINFHPSIVPSEDKKISMSKNIFLLNFRGDENDFLLNNFDLFITDYSSMYSEFLLFKKPIILAPFDYKNYQKYDRNLSKEYFDLPSYFVYDWTQLSYRLEVILNQKKDKHYKSRELFKEKIYEKKTESCFHEIIQMIDHL